MRLLTLLALAACAEPVIEMKLDMPQQVPAGFDVSCVSSITVLAHGEFLGSETEPPEVVRQCVDVTGMSSFDDLRNAMAGQFTLDLPDSGLLGITLRGSTGSCDELPDFHEAIFYGGSPATGDSLRIPVVPNLSCTARGKVLPVHPVDVLALSATKQCPVTTNGRAFAGNYRPILLGDELPPMTFEFGESASSQWMAGTARIEVFSQAASAKTCVGAGYGSPAEVAGARCVEDTTSVCAAPGELELPIIASDYAFQSLDFDLIRAHGDPVFGAAWEVGTAATKVPVAGATVTLEDPSQGTVVYVDKGPTKFTVRPGATSTGPDGFFLVYVKGAPTNITVTGPQHNAVRYKVATSADSYSTVIAALTRR